MESRNREEEVGVKCIIWGSSHWCLGIPHSTLWYFPCEALPKGCYKRSHPNPFQGLSAVSPRNNILVFAHNPTITIYTSRSCCHHETLLCFLNCELNCNLYWYFMIVMHRIKESVCIVYLFFPSLSLQASLKCFSSILVGLQVHYLC